MACHSQATSPSPPLPSHVFLPSVSPCCACHFDVLFFTLCVPFLSLSLDSLNSTAHTCVRRTLLMVLLLGVTPSAVRQRRDLYTIKFKCARHSPPSPPSPLVIIGDRPSCFAVRVPVFVAEDRGCGGAASHASSPCSCFGGTNDRFSEMSGMGWAAAGVVAGDVGWAERHRAARAPAHWPSDSVAMVASRILPPPFFVFGC